MKDFIKPFRQENTKINRRSFIRFSILGIIGIKGIISSRDSEEILPPEFLYDGHTVAWYDFSHSKYGVKRLIVRDIADSIEHRKKMYDYLKLTMR
jgi:hypothetical protein